MKKKSLVIALIGGFLLLSTAGIGIACIHADLKMAHWDLQEFILDAKYEKCNLLLHVGHLDSSCYPRGWIVEDGIPKPPNGMTATEWWAQQDKEFLPPATGPFGFQGVTRSQAIGFGCVPSGTDMLKCSTAPLPNHLFGVYWLLFSPTRGLVGISANGNIVTPGDTGDELMMNYNSIVDAISIKYGKPSSNSNVCNASLECDRPEFFMMSMLDKDRKVESFWITPTHVNGVTAIHVKINVDNGVEGYVSVAYQLDGCVQYLNEKKAKENQNY